MLYSVDKLEALAKHVQKLSTENTDPRISALLVSRRYFLCELAYFIVLAVCIMRPQCRPGVRFVAICCWCRRRILLWSLLNEETCSAGHGITR